MSFLAALWVVIASPRQDAAPLPWAIEIPENVRGLEPGELLLGTLNCVACHAAERAVAHQLVAPPVMLLEGIGARATPQFLRAFLTQPQRTKPGTIMPDLLHGDRESIDVLVHYLVSHGGPMVTDDAPVRPDDAERGKQLFERVGCVACHGGEGDRGLPIGPLAIKTTRTELARSLREAHAPRLDVGQGEALAIATHLLRDQLVRGDDGTPRSAREPGLVWASYEGHFDALPEFASLTPVATGVSDRFTLDGIKPRDRLFAIEFSGAIAIAPRGEYTFSVTSDDGSRLFLDGRELIDNDGVHPMEEKQATITLEPGEHSLRVQFSQIEGELGLEVALAGPGIAKRAIAASELSHSSQVLHLAQTERFVLDPAKVERGRVLFQSIGCAACHGNGEARAITLAHITDVGRGCLAEPVLAPGADYRLSALQRAALRRALKTKEYLKTPRSASEMALRVMTTMQCLACHERDQVGGPSARRASLFTLRIAADLGDEGRLPPPLTGVGAKLSASGLRHTLLDHLRVRPYMATRMPRYDAAAVSELIAWIEAADGMPTAAPPAATDAEIAAGRRLLGLRGLSCISCHGINGHESRGIPAVDLAFVRERLRYSWFRDYLLDPGKLRPGTRMPQFWVDGVSPFRDLLGGDPDRQINALWAYLSLGDAVPLPEGIDQGSGLELVVEDQPIVFRTFVNGVGPRAIAIGFPERVNAAFDGGQPRLARVWHGRFLNAEGTWADRAGQFTDPLGTDVIELPAGPPFAMLADRAASWPRASSWQMRGYRFDAERRPAFLYGDASAAIEERLEGRAQSGQCSLVRSFRIRTSETALHLRAAVGKAIDALDDRTFRVDGRLTIRCTLPAGLSAIVRSIDGEQELLVPAAPEFELEMWW